MHHPLPLSYAARREVVERVVPLYQEVLSELRTRPEMR